MNKDLSVQHESNSSYMDEQSESSKPGPGMGSTNTTPSNEGEQLQRDERVGECELEGSVLDASESIGGDSEDFQNGLDDGALFVRSTGRDCYPEGDEQYYCLGCDLVPLLVDEYSGTTLVHQIFSLTSSSNYPYAFGRCLELANSIAITPGKKLSTWAISIHKQRGSDGFKDESHIHLLHSCQTYNKSTRHELCRCGPIRGWRPLMFESKLRYFLEPTKRHLETLFLYLAKAEREYNEIYIAGHYYRRATGNESFAAAKCGRSAEGANGCNQTGGCGGSRNILGFGPCQENEEGNVFTPLIGNHGEQSEQPDNLFPGQQAAKKILEWFPESLSGLRKIKEFENKFAAFYWDERKFNSVMPIAWAHAVREWNQMSFKEIVETRRKTPRTFLKSSKTYYGPKYSSLLLGRLILEQYHDKELAKQFFKQVFQVLDKEVSKINTICVVSGPGAGKTYFFESLLALVWNIGFIRNSKKGGDTFTFQDAFNKRLMIWNECSMTGKENVETSKQVWEGDSVSINVKFEKGVLLERTPLIVTSNNPPWNMVPAERGAFMQRCYYNSWSPQSWLKDVAYYPSPLAWHFLLKNFEKDDWWDALPPTEHFKDKITDRPHFLTYGYLHSTWIDEKENTSASKRELETEDNGIKRQKTL